MSSSSAVNEIAVLNINCLLGENMKKIILGVAAALIMSTNAFAANGNNNNPSDVVVVGNGTGSVQVNQCVSVAGNCNNPDMTVNFNGDVDSVTINGKSTVIKGKDGKDGATGAKGEKGDTGATGAAGKDGKDGADGKDADMTLVNQNTSDISDLKATKADKADLNKEVNDRKSADQNLQNQINANNLHDVIQDAAIVGLAVTKADKSDLNKESAERKAADVALNGKIDQAVSNQTVVDKAQNTAIGNAQNTANVALGVGIANSIGLAAESAQRSLTDAALNNKIDKNKEDQVLVDNAQNDHINAVQNAAQTANDRATDLEKRADTVEKNVRDTNAQLEVTDARSINNAQRLDSVESKNAEQDSLISTKADKTALDKETADRKASDEVLGGAIASEGVARAAGDAALNTKIDSNKAAQKVTDDAQDAVINTKASKKDLTAEVAERKSADTKLQKNINREANTRAQADAVLSSRIDNNDATLVQHDERITSNTQRVGAVEGRVSNLEQSTNKRFSQMDKRIGDNRKLASAGIAGAGAMANIPQVSQGSTFSVGAGVGGYDSEQAVAVGFSARVNNNVVTKMSVSTNTQSEILWGAGVGVEW